MRAKSLATRFGCAGVLITISGVATLSFREINASARKHTQHPSESSGAAEGQGVSQSAGAAGHGHGLGRGGGLYQRGEGVEGGEPGVGCVGESGSGSGFGVSAEAYTNA